MRKLMLRTAAASIVATIVFAGLAPVGAVARVGEKKARKTTVNVVVGDTEGTKADMTMTVDPESAPHGKVKFVVTNEGTIIHEVVVVKLKKGATWDKLAVNPRTHRVSEAGAVGEVADVGKGKTKSVTLKLKKGDYALVCGIAKHYDLGMRAPFTVT